MEVIQDARRRGNLSVRRRHEGITAPQLVEADMWITLGANLLACSAAPFEDDLKIVFLAVGSIFIWVGVDILSWEPAPLDPINHANKDRGIDSFSDEYCYREYDYNDRIHGKGYDFSKYFYFVILMDSLTFEKINDLSDDKFMVILLYNEVILYLF